MFKGKCEPGDCPPNLFSVGTEALGRTCQACQRNCHKCADTATCTVCGQNRFLHQKSCVPTCPFGYLGIGAGPTSRKCTACIADCDVCSDTTTCSQCTNFKFLQKGKCLETCPHELYRAGTGTGGRKCTDPAERMLSFQYSWRKGDDSVVTKSVVADASCKSSGSCTMEVGISDEENINDGIFKWLNALHLAYNQRVAMHTGLVH